MKSEVFQIISQFEGKLLENLKNLDRNCGLKMKNKGTGYIFIFWDIRYRYPVEAPSKLEKI